VFWPIKHVAERTKRLRAETLLLQVTYLLGSSAIICNRCTAVAYRTIMRGSREEKLSH
jgi:hypothetical protein